MLMPLVMEQQIHCGEIVLVQYTKYLNCTYSLLSLLYSRRPMPKTTKPVVVSHDGLCFFNLDAGSGPGGSGPATLI